MRLRARVARSSSRVRKLCTGQPAAVRLFDERVLKNVNVRVKYDLETITFGEINMLLEQTPDWVEDWRNQVIEEGIVKGIEKGMVQGIEKEREAALVRDRALVMSLVVRKFGIQVNGNFSPLLEQIQEPDNLAAMAEWVFDCDHVEELLLRTKKLLNS